MMPHNLNQLTQHVYWFTPDSDTDRPILGLIVGEHSSLMVDAGASVKHTQEFLSAVKQAGLPEPSYCVLTHWHWDHSFGAEALNVPLIAHSKTAEALKLQASYSFSDAALETRVEQGLEIAFCRDYMKLEMTEAERLALKLRLPDVIFEDELTLNLGGVSCQLKHVGGDHAEDSVLIYVPEDKVLFLGDCAYQCLYSKLVYYSSKTTLALVDTLSTFDTEFALESHNDEVYTKDGFQNYLKTLETCATLVQNYTDELTLKQEIKKHLPDLDQEDVDEYTMMFLNGLKSRAELALSSE